MSITRTFQRGGAAIWFIVTMDATGAITQLEEHDWHEGGVVKDWASPAEREEYFLNEAPTRWTDDGVRAEAEAFLSAMRKEIDG